MARLNFERSMIEVSLGPLKKHLLEITALEKDRADARDYPAAIAARNERRKVEDELGGSTSTSSYCKPENNP